MDILLNDFCVRRHDGKPTVRVSSRRGRHHAHGGPAALPLLLLLLLPLAPFSLSLSLSLLPLQLQSLLPPPPVRRPRRGVNRGGVLRAGKVAIEQWFAEHRRIDCTGTWDYGGRFLQLLFAVTSLSYNFHSFRGHFFQAFVVWENLLLVELAHRRPPESKDSLEDYQHRADENNNPSYQPARHPRGVKVDVYIGLSDGG